ncbi:MAG: site-specific integrase [Parasporobacterium sp.]|nr:site-specific integrase [Parasporobacterium sp.]
MTDIRELQVKPEQVQRYGVYTFRTATRDGTVYARSFLVIRNGYGVIVRFTRLQDYAGFKNYKPITSNAEKKLYYVCGMLNYVLVDHGRRFGIRHVFGITAEMLQEYFDFYASAAKADGVYRSRDSILKCIGAVTAFMANLVWKFGGHMKLSRQDLYRDEIAYDRNGRRYHRAVPLFQAVGMPVRRRIFRDIPYKVFEILIPMAFRYSRDIAFGLCLQAFAGLRAGEVLSVRQECSPLGKGITFTEIGGRVVKAVIDVEQEVLIRDDDVEVSMIKKERLQGVYPAFLKAFCKAYEIHKEYLSGCTFDRDYCPMFINRNGEAMTYESYRIRFHDLVNNHLRPYLIQSADPELRLYGQLLYENQLGTHALRHWFTVQLVLRGEDIGAIQYWRGDSSPDSAFEYLQNKGDLTRELEAAGDRLVELLISEWEGDDDGIV